MRRLTTIISALAALLCGLALNADEPLPAARHKPLPVSEFHRHFEPVPVKSETGPLYGGRAYLGTAGTPAAYNSLTLGWGATGTLWGRPVAIVYIRETRFSYRFFEGSDIFTLSWYPKQNMQAVLKIFGGTSGRSTDKEKRSGFTPVETPDGGVTYLEAERVLVCRKLMRQPVPQEFVPKDRKGKLNQDGRIHIQYTGEVLSVWKKKTQEK